MSAETVTLVGQQVKGITHGVQIVKRKEWFEKLGYDHPLYQVIAMCLQETPLKRWEMDKVRTEMNKLSSKPPPKLIDLLRQNEVLREDMLRLTDKTRDDVTKVNYTHVYTKYILSLTLACLGGMEQLLCLSVCLCINYHIFWKLKKIATSSEVLLNLQCHFTL